MVASVKQELGVGWLSLWYHQRYVTDYSDRSKPDLKKREAGGTAITSFQNISGKVGGIVGYFYFLLYAF